jgi:hypothetical protein
VSLLNLLKLHIKHFKHTLLILLRKEINGLGNPLLLAIAALQANNSFFQRNVTLPSKLCGIPVLQSLLQPQAMAYGI